MNPRGGPGRGSSGSGSQWPAPSHIARPQRGVGAAVVLVHSGLLPPTLRAHNAVPRQQEFCSGSNDPNFLVRSSPLFFIIRPPSHNEKLAWTRSQIFFKEGGTLIEERKLQEENNKSRPLIQSRRTGEDGFPLLFRLRAYDCAFVFSGSLDSRKFRFRRAVQEPIHGFVVERVVRVQGLGLFVTSIVK